MDEIHERQTEDGDGAKQIAESTIARVLPPLENDDRFAAALRHLDAGDWLEAADLFEELFFEAVRDEVPLVRFLLQVSTGMHHISRGQRRAAIERLEEALRVAGEVGNRRGVDVAGMSARAREAIRRVKGEE